MAGSWKGVRGGTPMHNKSMCDSCANAHIVKGAAESEKLTICDAVYYKPNPVPFQFVVECNSYRQRNRVTIGEMEKIAYILESDPRGRPIGFKPAAQFRKDSGLERDDELAPRPAGY